MWSWLFGTSSSSSAPRGGASFPSGASHLTVCWPPSRTMFSSTGAVPFAFVGVHNSTRRTLDGALLINVRESEDTTTKVRVTAPASDAMLADVELEPFQQSGAYSEIDAAAIVILGVRHESSPSPVAERAVAAEIEAMQFCVKKYGAVACSSSRDVALALRLVIAELAPFLDADMRAQFIDWYCAQLVDGSQDVVFVYRKPLVRPRVVRG